MDYTSFHTNLKLYFSQALKFVRLIHLNAIRRLVDILDQDTEGLDASVMSTASSVSTLTSNVSSVMLPRGEREHSTNLVAIVCRGTEDLRERCYTLQLVVDTQEDKWAWLKVWSCVVCLVTIVIPLLVAADVSPRE